MKLLGSTTEDARFTMIHCSWISKALNLPDCILRRYSVLVLVCVWHGMTRLVLHLEVSVLLFDRKISRIFHFLKEQNYHILIVIWFKTKLVERTYGFGLPSWRIQQCDTVNQFFLRGNVFLPKQLLFLAINRTYGMFINVWHMSSQPIRGHG